MSEMQIYCKSTSNSQGMPLTSFEILSEEWSGDSLILPFGEEGEQERKSVVGWTDLVFGNPYPDVVRGCPTTVRCAKVRQGDNVGFLVWGGNSGVRIGGRNGWGQPVVWISTEDVSDLPAKVRSAIGA